ncbi:SHOCT domain-containing protein (plasmid) [Streptomyces mirabilis]|uniref:SHOCT domain-containing protein n=1 Tax=Streptomyces mirabilis TaxID=68239 RepID=UPI001BAEF5A1|nr:SHOCT domain-containing protein [Streptomyces mirabilis]QUW85836.1 SHOCT domain-containing protein [Streptomyces mirabilis]
MMFWYDHNVSGWGWFTMSVGMVLFWAVIIGVGVLLYRALSNPLGRTDVHAPPGRIPEQLLAERFARGEIDEDEYRQRLAALHEAPSPPKRA